MGDTATKAVAFTALGMVLVLSVIGGIQFFGENDVYYCGSEDIVRQCDRLSQSKRTCYFNETRDLCSNNGTWMTPEEISLSHP